MELEISVIRIHSNETPLVTSLVNFLSIVEPVGALFKLSVPLPVSEREKIKSSGEKAEAALKKLFSETKATGPTTKPFNPLPQPGLQNWANEFRIFLSEDTEINRLITVHHIRVESLIGQGGLAERIPADATDIKRTQFPRSAGEKPVRLDELFRNETEPLYLSLARETRESIQDFCKKAHDELGNKLSLERIDRTAVIWAYLMASPWSNRGTHRPSTDAEDHCIMALRDAGDGKTLKQLTYTRSLNPEFGNERDRVWLASKPYRESDVPKQGGRIPIAIIRGAEHSNWADMLSDSVRISAGRKGIKLGNGRTLDPGDVITREGPEAAKILHATSFSWVPSKAGGASCFSKSDVNTTRRAFVASGSCMQLSLTSGESADLPTEFIVEEVRDGVTPRIQEVRFFP